MASLNASLTELADIISSRTKQIEEYLMKKNLPQPSLAVGAPDDYIERDDAELQQARTELRNAAWQLHRLSGGTQQTLLEMTLFDMHDANAHRLLWEHKIPLNVPSEGSITYADLAKKCNMNEDKLTRVVQYETTNFIFHEPKPGHVAHTAISKLMTDPIAWSWVGHAEGDCYPAIKNMDAAIRKWPNGSTPFETAVQVAFNTDKDLFGYYQETNPELMGRFGKAMQFISACTMQTVLEFDWKSLGKATLVDVGGSNGHKSVEITRANPQIHCIVQDLPDCIKAVPPVPEDVKGRVEFEEYDMFTPQKHTEADVFFMARVFHDWPDADCVKIIKNMEPAMKKGARLVLNELIKGTPVAEDLYRQKLGYWADLHMMGLMNSRERTEEDWKRVITEGSGGSLKLESAKGSNLSFIKT